MNTSREALHAGLGDGGITVRMYRQGGLGDCFLLAFPPADDPRYLLIDCGVFTGTRGGSARMRAIAQDVVEVTGNHLHALVATHEHWDHLAGFQYARAAFDALAVDEVWVAWTEDRSDDLANELRGKRRRTARALAAAVTHLARPRSRSAPRRWARCSASGSAWTTTARRTCWAPTRPAPRARWTTSARSGGRRASCVPAPTCAGPGCASTSSARRSTARCSSAPIRRAPTARCTRRRRSPAPPPSAWRRSPPRRSR